MDLNLIVNELELRQALVDFLPMQLAFGEGEGKPWIRIDTVETLDLVPHRGLRLVCSARVHYPVPVLSGDFTVSHAIIEMEPAIVEGEDGPVLAFKLDIADFDMKYLPSFVDNAIAKKINAELRERVATIAWNFSKTLTRSIELPERLSLVRRAKLGPPCGEVEVGAHAIALRISLPVSFAHDELTHT